MDENTSRPVHWIGPDSNPPEFRPGDGITVTEQPIHGYVEGGDLRTWCMCGACDPFERNETPHAQPL